MGINHQYSLNIQIKLGDEENTCPTND